MKPEKSLIPHDQGGLALTPIGNRGIRQLTIAGSLTVGNLLGLIHASNIGFYYGVDELIGTFLGGALGGAILASMIALFRWKPRNTSLNRAERELSKALSMMEKGLINREDYESLKQEILQNRLSRPFEWTISAWGGVLGMTLAAIIMSEGVAILGLIAGAILSAVTASTYIFARQYLELDDPSSPELPPQQHWEQLGSRSSDSPDR